MFKLAAVNKDKQHPLHELLMELTLQGVDFEAQSSDIGEPTEPEIRTLPLRLISAQSAMLFNAMKQADRAYARTNWTVQQGNMTHRRQNEMAQGFEIA